MPDWRPGGEFTAGELRVQQKHRLQRLRRHLRLVHGWGVVCGLNVVSVGGWCLTVCPGYGIGPCGDEIFVPSAFRFDLRDYLWTQPVGNQSNRVWIAIEAGAVAYEPAPDLECGCGCGNDHEKTSGFADVLKIVVSWTPPVLPRGGFDVCSGATPRCPPCPDFCGLPLASIAVPPLDQAILKSAIDNLGGV
jgi:hypothetical protein